VTEFERGHVHVGEAPASITAGRSRASGARCVAKLELGNEDESDHHPRWFTTRWSEMPRIKQIAAMLLLGVGLSFALLALTIFLAPFVATFAGTYEGGAQAWGGFLFYLLIALPACGATGAAIFLRGWRESRVGYIVLGVLFGVLLLVFLVAAVCAL